MKKYPKIFTILADIICEIVLLPFHIMEAIFDIFSLLKK